MTLIKFKHGYFTCISSVGLEPMGGSHYRYAFLHIGVLRPCYLYEDIPYINKDDPYI